MQRIFPRALIACIAENRLPESLELGLLADKVWREAYNGGSELGHRERAARIADAALHGNKIAA